MKNVVIAFAVIVAFAACNNASKKNTSTDASTQKAACTVMSVDSFLKVAVNYVGKEVTVQGAVDHVCKHGGKKVKLISPCGKLSVHGMATENMGVFEADIEGSDICMTGVVIEDRMTMDDVDAWEAKIEENKGEKAEGEHGKAYDHHASADKIKEQRAMIEKSENGYISSYHVDVTSYKVCETAAEATTEEQKPCCEKVVAACCDKKEEPAKKEGSCCDKKETKTCSEKE